MSAFLIEKELDETNIIEFLDPNNQNSFAVCPPQKLPEQDIVKISETRNGKTTLLIFTDDLNLRIYLQKANIIMTSNQQIPFRAITGQEMTQTPKNTIIIIWNPMELPNIYSFQGRYNIFTNISK